MLSDTADRAAGTEKASIITPLKKDKPGVVMEDFLLLVRMIFQVPDNPRHVHFLKAHFTSCNKQAADAAVFQTVISRIPDPSYGAGRKSDSPGALNMKNKRINRVFKKNEFLPMKFAFLLYPGP